MFSSFETGTTVVKYHGRVQIPQSNAGTCRTIIPGCYYCLEMIFWVGGANYSSHGGLMWSGWSSITWQGANTTVNAMLNRT